MRLNRLLVEQHLNPEILRELDKDTQLGKHLRDILSIVPENVSVVEYCENTWYAYCESQHRRE